MQADIEKFQEFYNVIITFFVTYSFQLMGALIILLLGLLISNRLARLVLTVCEKNNLDITLSKFLASCTKIIIIAIVAIICLGKIGISVTPLVAALGAASLGAGLAMQGLLSNYAAGLNIILTRPFVVGDTIHVQGVTGIVDEVRLAYTILTDEDEVCISIPNRHIAGEIIHNSKAFRVVETTMGIAYDSELSVVRDLLNKELTKMGVTENRQPVIGIDTFGDSGINIAIRFWVPTEKFHRLRMHTNEQLFNALKGAGIQMPYPQTEITILQNTNN
ncbi:MAG: mechanosensitive ion channel [Pseudomonadales bacterium]|nr:mechanosensitive ion channel [Pseudomonadales bacterium]